MKIRNSAFTLIELLVVIAIIAILAAILFPVFAQARAKARQVVCMSNEKQIATAMIMYAPDYDDRWIDRCAGYNALNLNDCSGLPQWALPKNNPSIYDKEFLIKPYIKNTDVLACPTLHKDTVKYIGGLYLPVTGLYPNYALNELYATGDNSPYTSGKTAGNPAYLPPDYNRSNNHWFATGPFGRKNAQLSQPASLIVMWEHNNLAVHCNTWSTQHDQTPDHWDASHHGGFNVAYADGHVKRMTLGGMTNQQVCYWDLPTTP